ncbi:LysR family transcriptional regulator [Octadecabacter ascidiaceicola]|uniref:Glycine cleavage system transcriptional activator n=1 Tax=Octadecabacter ascidiaceicola TaxID=1655543 RepID=A0A238JQ80_9RHOB|nr:LysR family transcriptional regulator [Octadecabacter ascidiaceicola]SMX32811.1 Glycine cleavage system transcriptional activator [Octadecabacter ascidiaceicola]
MKQNLNLNWLRTFDAAARHLSFTAASHDLGLTQTAVSQHIKALETKLGQNLFIRRARSLQLTEIGQAYLISVRDALEHIDFSTSGLFGPELRTTIVVRASAAMIIWLSARVSDFQDKYPNTGIKLVTSLWQNEMEKHPVDVEIVLAAQNQSDHRMVKLSEERIVPVCGARTSANILTPVDLMQCEKVHVLGFDDHWARYLSANGLPTGVVSPRIVVDTSVAACELAAAENGCAIMFERFAQQAIEAGRPIRIVGEPVSNGQSHYVIQRNSASSEKRASAEFCEWLTTCF